VGRGPLLRLGYVVMLDLIFLILHTFAFAGAITGSMTGRKDGNQQPCDGYAVASEC
jgi:hypothetical protein